MGASSTSSRGQSGRSSSQGRSYTRPRTTSKFPVNPYPPTHLHQHTIYGTIEHLLHRKRNFHRDSVPPPRLRNHQKESNSSESQKLSEKWSILPAALRIREKATSLFNKIRLL